MRILFPGLILCIFFSVEPAHAWGPATHLFYGYQVLDHLPYVADMFRAVLAAHPLAFLYGCVGADIVLAKKMGPLASHGHRWDNALRLLDTAPNDRTQSFSLGYLCHLAADTVSHNSYVPSKTIESFESGVLKHLYWEMRFDQKLTSSRTLEAFQKIVEHDFSDCDAHMAQLIPVRVFSFSTNKKVFNHLLVLQGLKNWQNMLLAMGQSQKHKFKDREIEEFVQKSMDAVFLFFKQGKDSKTCLDDPIGQIRLKQANELRRHLWLQKKLHFDHATDVAREATQRFKKTTSELINIEDYKINL